MYNKIPKNLGVFNCQVEEYFNFLYLPIKLRGQTELTYEERLKPFDKILGRAACDFIGDFGLDNFVDSFVYLTAKHAYQRGGTGFNRNGFHADGFGTDDSSYLWSNCQPTVFNNSDFVLSADDVDSMRQMKEQAKEENNYTFLNGSLLRLDQFSIHKVGQYIEGNRAFCKICFSKDKYNLKGNSINYLLDYKWEYQERKKERNIPQNLLTTQKSVI